MPKIHSSDSVICACAAQPRRAARSRWHSAAPYPLYPQKRTSVGPSSMSAMCQKRTLRCQACRCTLAMASGRWPNRRTAMLRSFQGAGREKRGFTMQRLERCARCVDLINDLISIFCGLPLACLYRDNRWHQPLLWIPNRLQEKPLEVGRCTRLFLCARQISHEGVAAIS